MLDAMHKHKFIQAWPLQCHSHRHNAVDHTIQKCWTQFGHWVWFRFWRCFKFGLLCKLRTDVWALAMTFLEIFAGAPLWSEIMHKKWPGPGCTPVQRQACLQKSCNSSGQCNNCEHCQGTSKCLTQCHVFALLLFQYSSCLCAAGSGICQDVVHWRNAGLVP